MRLTPARFVAKWANIFANNDDFDITAAQLREYAVDCADSFGADVATAPYYVFGPTYVADYLVRYVLPGQPESFFYSLKAGKLPAPTATGDLNWKVVPGPVAATALSQSLTLLQAQGIQGSQVVAGRTYLIDFGSHETVSVRGVSNNTFDVEGTLEVNGAITPITSIDVFAGTYQVKGTGGGTGPAGSTYYTATYNAPADGVQTITKADVPGLAQATDVIQVGILAADGTLDPEFALDTGYTFDVATHTLRVFGGNAAPGDYIRRDDRLLIKWITGALTSAPGGPSGPVGFDDLTGQPGDNPALAAVLQQYTQADSDFDLRLDTLEKQPLPALIARDLGQNPIYGGVDMVTALAAIASTAPRIYGTLFCFLNTTLSADAILAAGTRLLGNGLDLTMNGHTLSHREGSRILNLTLEGGVTQATGQGPLGPPTVFIGGWSLNMQHRAVAGVTVRMINREFQNNDPAAIVYAGGGTFELYGTTPNPLPAQVEPGTTVRRGDMQGGLLCFEGSTGTFVNALGVSVGATNQFVFLPVNDRRTDFGNGWDAATNRYTIPVSGTYLVGYDVKPEDSSNTRNYVGTDFFAGISPTTAADTPGQGKWGQVSPSTRSSVSRSLTIHLAAGDKIGLSHNQVGANYNILNSLSIFLLKAD